MSDQERLSISEIKQFVEEYPDLPSDYLAYLRDVGWGETSSGHMIYGGPTSPDDVYPQLAGDKQHILIGDDFQGYCLGYDFAAKRYGEFSDSGEWEPFDEGFDLAAHLTAD
jgi:hypothetical protein